MILLLYGSDTYRSRRKLNEIIEEYRKKSGPYFGFYRFDAQESDLAPLKSVLETQSLFSSKKLTIIENALAGSSNLEPLMNSWEQIKGSQDVIVVLWDRSSALDTKDAKKTFGNPESYSKVQEFKLLRGDALRRWILEEAQRRGLKLFPIHWAYLTTFGSDLWAIANELDKLVICAETGVAAGRGYTIFELGDAFFTSPIQALGILLSMLGQGQDDFELFSYLLNYCRTLLIVKSYLAYGQPPSNRHNIHPFVIKKTSSLVRALPLQKLRDLFCEFFEEDIRIKTGASKPKESLLRILRAVAN